MEIRPSWRRLARAAKQLSELVSEVGQKIDRAGVGFSGSARKLSELASAAREKNCPSWRWQTNLVLQGRPYAGSRRENKANRPTGAFLRIWTSQGDLGRIGTAIGMNYDVGSSHFVLGVVEPLEFQTVIVLENYLTFLYSKL